MSGLPLPVSGLGVTLVAFTLVWLASLRLRDASIADPFWGPGFLILTLTYLVAGDGPSPRGILVTGLVAAWALRLGAHLWIRNRGHGEDPRYQAMRARHGDRFGRVSLFTVFWLQAVILWVVALPVLGAVTGSRSLGAWDAAGVVLVLSGLSTEAVADAQLARFRADPANKGKVLDTGLWRYSRHPNYFGDAVLWWGFYLLSVGAGVFWTLPGPLLMTFLLLKVSGVTLLERTLVEGRPGYAAYVRRTSSFIPWFPRTPRA